MPSVLKSGSLNLLEPSGPVMGLLYLFFIRACSTVVEDLNPLLLDKGASLYILTSSLFTIIV